MAGFGLTVSPGFILLAAALYFVGGGGAVTAFLSAALAHELGHLGVMWLMGGDVRKIRVTPCGPVIEYSGVFTPRQEMGIIAAGPLSGLLFAVLCFQIGTEYFRFAGAVALLATAFNLLPVYPMDGGRLLRMLLEETMPEEWAENVMRICGSLCAVGVAATGVMAHSPAAAAVGIWMAALANIPDLR